MHMKILAFATAVALSASAAHSADAVVQEPTYQEQGHSGYDWSGFYLGLQGGYTWTHASYLGGSEQDLNGASSDRLRDTEAGSKGRKKRGGSANGRCAAAFLPSDLP